MIRPLVYSLVRRNNFGSLFDLFRLEFRRRFLGTSSYRPEIFYGNISRMEGLEFRLTGPPLVSIIIPAHNNWEYTHSCLYSVRHNTDGVPYQVLVADDASDDETRTISDHASGLEIIRNEKNLGFIRTCNMAARKAKGKYLLFLNNDTNVQHKWMDGLVALLEEDSGVGLVGSKLVYPDGRLQDAGGIVWNDGTCWIYGRWDDPQKEKYNSAREVDYVSGACMMIRKELWDSIGGFDERYCPAYYEDTDLAMEVRKRGYKVVYQPDSVVVHFEGISCGKNVKRDTKRYQEINRQKFFRKWESVLKAEYPEPGTIRPWRTGNRK